MKSHLKKLAFLFLLANLALTTNINGQYFNGEIECEYIFFQDDITSKVSPNNDTSFVKFTFCRDTMNWQIKGDDRLGIQIGTKVYQKPNGNIINITESIIEAGKRGSPKKNFLLKSKRANLDVVRYGFQVGIDRYNIWINEESKFPSSSQLGKFFRFFFQEEGFFLDYVNMDEIDIGERQIKKIKFKECNCKEIIEQ